VNVTVAPTTGLFETSSNVAVSADVETPFATIDVGLAATVMLPPAKPPVMVIVMVLVLAPEVAVTCTVVFTFDIAVRVTVAFPFAVRALLEVRLAFSASLGTGKVKETTVLFATGFPLPSTTCAVMVDVPPTKTEFGLAVKLSAEVAEAVIVIEAEPKPVTPAAVTVAVTVPVLPPAVKVTWATPPVVVAVGLESVPSVPVLSTKLTSVPSGTRLPAASLTVALIDVMPKVLMEVGFAETVIPEVAPVTTPVPGPVLLILEGLQPTADRSRRKKTTIMNDLAYLIKASKACVRALFCTRCGNRTACYSA
jgi:hypothetical protein